MPPIRRGVSAPRGLAPVEAPGADGLAEPAGRALGHGPRRLPPVRARCPPAEEKRLLHHPPFSASPLFVLISRNSEDSCSSPKHGASPGSWVNLSNFTPFTLFHVVECFPSGRQRNFMLLAFSETAGGVRSGQCTWLSPGALGHNWDCDSRGWVFRPHAGRGLGWKWHCFPSVRFPLHQSHYFGEMPNVQGLFCSFEEEHC